jgi:hypothetical protein
MGRRFLDFSVSLLSSPVQISLDIRFKSYLLFFSERVFGFSFRCIQRPRQAFPCSASLGGLHVGHFHEERYSLTATSRVTRVFCLMSLMIGLHLFTEHGMPLYEGTASPFSLYSDWH